MRHGKDDDGFYLPPPSGDDGGALAVILTLIVVVLLVHACATPSKAQDAPVDLLLSTAVVVMHEAPIDRRCDQRGWRVRLANGTAMDAVALDYIIDQRRLDLRAAVPRPSCVIRQGFE